ncbi:unnamed protein product [Oikopleura dioica]|uniref:Anaphase-promoting complex subunit 13 n=1 Tax=Oikopleura dioica TaxID=34765 RepID=E4X485_OIKDI|nr:unnamed protein product [Oikopleura dioica]CBY35063.1 unnamed protein product [Oikopleura dioica]
MSGLMRDPKISLIIDEKWRSAVLPIDDLEINSDFIPNEEENEGSKECAIDLDRKWNEHLDITTR